jgi:hypothetical protein
MCLFTNCLYIKNTQLPYERMRLLEPLLRTYGVSLFIAGDDPGGGGGFAMKMGVLGVKMG